MMRRGRFETHKVVRIYLYDHLCETQKNRDWEIDNKLTGFRKGTSLGVLKEAHTTLKL